MTTIYLNNNPTSSSSVYHVEESCIKNHRSFFIEREVDEAGLELLSAAGIKPCKNCFLRRHRVEQQAKAVEYLRRSGLMPQLELLKQANLEVRVLWHDPGVTAPRLIWSSYDEPD